MEENGGKLHSLSFLLFFPSAGIHPAAVYASRQFSGAIIFSSHAPQIVSSPCLHQPPHLHTPYYPLANLHKFCHTCFCFASPPPTRTFPNLPRRFLLSCYTWAHLHTHPFHTPSYTLLTHTHSLPHTPSHTLLKHTLPSSPHLLTFCFFHALYLTLLEAEKEECFFWSSSPLR